MNTFAAVFAASAAMLRGEVLHARNVTAGLGILVDWRHVKSGETVLVDADPFEVAALLVELVGPSAVLEAAEAA